MNLYLNEILLFATAIAHFFIGIFVFQKRKDIQNLIFSIFCLGLGGWVSCFILMRTTSHPLLWINLAGVFSVVMIGNLFSFCYIFPSNRKINKHLLALVYVPMIGLALSSKYAIAGIQVLPVGFNIQYGVLAPFFMFYDIAFTISAIAVLINNYSKVHGTARVRVKYFIFGISIGMGAGIICNAIVPVFFHTSILGSFGPVFTIFISIFTAYAIVTQRLMGIEVIIKKGTVYAVLAGAFTGVYSLLLLTFQALLDASHHLAVTMLTSLIMAIGFRPLHDWLEAVTDKIFYRRRPDYNTILQNFADNLSLFLGIKDLASFLVSTLLEGFKLEKASFFILNDDDITYYEQIYGEPLAKKKRKFKTKQLVEFSKNIANENQIYIYEELSDLKLPPEIKLTIQQEMENSQSKLVIPIISKTGVVYGIALGARLSQDTFSDDGIKALTIIAKQIKLALETIKLHSNLLNAQKDIAKSDKMATMGKLTQGIAHEIKNPMYAIETYFDVLPEDPHDSAEKKFFILSTKEAIRRIKNLAEQLGQFSRKPAVLIPTNVNDIVIEEINVHSIEFKALNIVVELNFSDLPIIKSDPNFLRQTIANIIINAKQAMPNGGRIIITTSLELKQNHILISIKDSGQGISADAIPNIFEPNISTKINGSGLGLALSADMINTLGGSISVESELGQGSVFTICLPVV